VCASAPRRRPRHTIAGRIGSAARVGRAAGIHIVIEDKIVMVKKMIFLFIATASTLYGFRSLKRKKSAGDKILHKEAVKEWESEGGNLAPQVPPASA